MASSPDCSDYEDCYDSEMWLPSSPSPPFALETVAEENLCGIPDEVWLKILRMSFGYYSPWHTRRLLILGRVSKKMYSLTKDASLWTEIWIEGQFPPLPIFKAMIDRSTKLRRFVLATKFTPYKEMITYALEKRGDTLEGMLIEHMYGASQVLVDIMEPIQKHGVALRKFLISGWSSKNDEMGVVEVKLAKRQAQLDLVPGDPYAILSALITHLKVEWPNDAEEIGDLTLAGTCSANDVGFESLFLDTLSGGRLFGSREKMVSNGLAPFRGRCPQLREVSFGNWSPCSSNTLVYMMLASLEALQHFTLGNSENSENLDSENYNIEGTIDFFDFVTKRKWHPKVSSLFNITKQIDEEWGEGKLVATRIAEGTQELRDSPLWDTEDEEESGDESESDKSED